jgi:hypothetical protein
LARMKHLNYESFLLLIYILLTLINKNIPFTKF